MPAALRTRVILVLDLAATPVAGTVIDSLGNEQPFAGWMALTRTIELTLDAARSGAMPAGDRSVMTTRRSP
jgi:hypothetical protein